MNLGNLSILLSFVNQLGTIEELTKLMLEFKDIERHLGVLEVISKAPVITLAIEYKVKNAYRDLIRHDCIVAYQEPPNIILKITPRGEQILSILKNEFVSEEEFILTNRASTFNGEDIVQTIGRGTFYVLRFQREQNVYTFIDPDKSCQDCKFMRIEKGAYKGKAWEYLRCEATKGHCSYACKGWEQKQ